MQEQLSSNTEENSLCGMELGKENQDQCWRLRSERRAGAGRIAGSTGMHWKLITFTECAPGRREGLWTLKQACSNTPSQPEEDRGCGPGCSISPALCVMNSPNSAPRRKHQGQIMTIPVPRDLFHSAPVLFLPSQRSGSQRSWNE